MNYLNISDKKHEISNSIIEVVEDTIQENNFDNSLKNVHKNPINLLYRNRNDYYSFNQSLIKKKRLRSLKIKPSKISTRSEKSYHDTYSATHSHNYYISKNNNTKLSDLRNELNQSKLFVPIQTSK